MLTKLLISLVAITVMASLIRRMIGIMQASRLRVRQSAPGRRQPVRRLRQDPRTGLYFPE